MAAARIGLFYGSSTCYTEIAAEKIQQWFKDHGDVEVDLFNLADAEVAEMENYSCIICGIPTWDYGELQEDWDRIWPQLDELKLDHCKAAIFGLGDQVGYPQWFQDALGYLYHKLEERDAQLVGLWPVDGYEFESSQALTEDKRFFLGLPLDEENEFELSEPRLNTWCEQLRREFQ